MSRDDCRKYLRFLELDAYSKMVSALRGQGPLTEGKQKLLGELASVLHISTERHQAEIRRAVNDDKLSIIAEQLFGPNTDTEWTVEGRRLIPLFPRLKGRTAYTTFANSVSLTASMANDRPPHFQKKEVKYKNSCCEPKYDEKLLNNGTENTFRYRKRNRSFLEGSKNLNNGSYLNYPTTSKQIYSNNILNNSRSFASPPTSIEQNPKTRQRVDIDN
uniref:ENT domain-containing protein n=2 Tax=Trichogramma TaxID=7490 RepID=A0ABD2XDR7_9HYME